LFSPFFVTSLPSDSSPIRRKRRIVRRLPRKRQRATPITLLFLLVLGMLVVQEIPKPSLKQIRDTVWVSHPQPLVMQGGDPYVRALMRTISAAESNTNEPYRVLYGGDSVEQLNRHPNICVEIVAGPNIGDCTTAAGRYQFLTETWEEKARKYHPKPPSWFEVWGEYSFDAQSQDQVVYQWLTDSTAWPIDIPASLRAGQIEEVLRHLSGTWTSLGYGIESNSMTARLPRIYQNLLAEELAAAQE
jgi:muramidase (phage lysozyme)